MINDLSTDFSDGVKLIHLLEILSDKVVGQKYRTNPTSRFVKIENVNIALRFISQTLKVQLYIIGAEGIYCLLLPLLLSLSMDLHYY